VSDELLKIRFITKDDANNHMVQKSLTSQAIHEAVEIRSSIVLSRIRKSGYQLRTSGIARCCLLSMEQILLKRNLSLAPSSWH
jgi:hypothetical protein